MRELSWPAKRLIGHLALEANVVAQFTRVRITLRFICRHARIFPRQSRHPLPCSSSKPTR
jgi:hypothetical protein